MVKSPIFLNFLVCALLATTCQTKTQYSGLEMLDRLFLSVLIITGISLIGIVVSGLPRILGLSKNIDPHSAIIDKVLDNNFDEVEKLTKKGWSINEINNEQTALNASIKHHNSQTVAAMLQKFPDSIIRSQDIHDALERFEKKDNRDALGIASVLLNNSDKIYNNFSLAQEEYKRNDAYGIRLIRKRLL